MRHEQAEFWSYLQRKLKVITRLNNSEFDSLEMINKLNEITTAKFIYFFSDGSRTRLSNLSILAISFSGPFAFS